MPAIPNNQPLPILGLILIGAAGLILGACQSTPASSRSNSSTPSLASATQPPDNARIWAENCGRCHFLRAPNEFSYDQWEVIVQHMRLRATLPARDTRAILEFLKAAAH